MRMFVVKAVSLVSNVCVLSTPVEDLCFNPAEKLTPSSLNFYKVIELLAFLPGLLLVPFR